MQAPRAGLLVLVLALCTPHAVAQSRTRATTPPSGAIDPELARAIRNAPTAEQWPNANYARILDTETVELRPDGTVVAHYREAFRIFNERGREVAEVSLPYNSSYQSVQVTRARTITRDGRVVSVRPEDMRVTSAYSDFALYDDSVSVGFSMPAVEDGCIIDYSWREVTRPLLMPGHFWDYWAFSGPEPVSLSRYVLKAPASRRFEWKAYNCGRLQPTVVTSRDGKWKTWTWQMTGLKPIELEPAMPGRREIRAFIEISTIPSWSHIARWYSGLAKPQTAHTDAMRAEVAKLTAGKKTARDKAAAIYDFVANRVRYVGLEFGLSAYRPHAAKDVFEKLYGDCKDKATLLVTLLGLAGIKAHPVLLDAEAREPKDKDLPTLTAFDHCIAVAEVDGREVWLDATAETCPYGDIPDSDRGAHALVVREGRGDFRWIPRYEPAQNGFDSTTVVDLRPDGSAEVHTETRMRGGSAQEWRQYARSITPEQRKQVAALMAQSFSVGGAVKSFDLPTGFDKADPFVIRMAISAPSRAKKTRSLLIIPVANTTTDSSRTHPFVKETRVWPIVVDEASEQKGETIIRVPEGYELEDVPLDLHLTNGLFEYHRTIERALDGKSITIRTLSIAKPGRVPPEDYARVRAHYDGVIQAMEDPIVLRRAGTAMSPGPVGPR